MQYIIHLKGWLQYTVDQEMFGCIFAVVINHDTKFATATNTVMMSITKISHKTFFDTEISQVYSI